MTCMPCRRNVQLERFYDQAFLCLSRFSNLKIFFRIQNNCDWQMGCTGWPRSGSDIFERRGDGCSGGEDDCGWQLFVCQEIQKDRETEIQKDRETEIQKDLPLKLTLLHVEQNQRQQKSCQKQSPYLINFLYQWWHVLPTISILFWSLVRGDLSSTMELRRLQFPTSLQRARPEK